MKTFTIDAENNIMAHATAEEAVAGAERFTTEAELNKLAAGWPAERLVEIWNSLPGSTPVKKFMDPKTAAGRIWKAIAGLGETAPAKPAPAPTKATAAPQKPDVAPAKGKATKKATPAKKGPKAPKAGKKAEKPEPTTKARAGSKTAQVVEMLKRPGGATLKDIMAATDWQAHSVRGFISGALGKKMGLSVDSTKGEDGSRTYSLKA